ncbi:MAG: tetratricopeptide repeat protein [Chthoniobacterales bacterium]
MREKKPREALVELDKALASEPRNRAALRLRAYLYLQQGQREKAIADYDVAINTIAEVDIEGRTRRVYVDRALKQNDKATADLETILKLKPKDKDAAEQLKALQKKKQGTNRRVTPGPANETGGGSSDESNRDVYAKIFSSRCALVHPSFPRARRAPRGSGFRAEQSVRA